MIRPVLLYLVIPLCFHICPPCGSAHCGPASCDMIMLRRRGAINIAVLLSRRVNASSELCQPREHATPQQPCAKGSVYYLILAAAPNVALHLSTRPHPKQLPHCILKTGTVGCIAYCGCPAAVQSAVPSVQQKTRLCQECRPLRAGSQPAA